MRRVDVTAKDHDRDTARAGQLERGGGRLGAAAGNPGIVHNEDIGADRRPGDPQPVHVHAPDVNHPRHGAQPDKRQVHAGLHDAEKRMVTRPALTARHDGDGRRPSAHAGLPPQGVAPFAQENGERLAQPRSGLWRA